MSWCREPYRHSLSAKGIRTVPRKMFVGSRGKGWRNESERHSLSARGIKTSRRDYLEKDEEWQKYLREVHSRKWEGVDDTFSRPLDFFREFEEFLPEGWLFEKVFDRYTGGFVYLLSANNNRMKLVMSEKVDKIIIHNIEAEHKGGGVGSIFMDSIKEYADANDLGVEVCEVANKKFFNKFDWLKPDRSSLFFEYKQEDD